MSPPADFDRLMAAWFAEDAAAAPPAFLAGAIADATRQRRPRPRWLARLRRAWAGDTALTRRGISGRGLLLLAATALIAMSTIAGALVAGSSPARLVPTSPPTWAFAVPRCEAVAPVPGSLPTTQRAPTEHPGNGLLAVDLPSGVALVDPASRRNVGSPRFLPSSGAPWIGTGPPDWSPDGRWLSLPLSTGCGRYILVAADGSRAVGVPTVPGATSFAWSPDSQWFAVWDGTSVDVEHIGPEGSVLESRRVWEGGGMFLAWGPDGTLAISDQHAIHLLRPGQEQPVDIAPELGVMAPLAWSGDGTTIITAADSGNAATVYAISPVTGKVTAINGDAPVVGGKFLDIPLVTSGDRAYFMGGGRIWSVAIDGADLRQVTPDASVEGHDWFTASPDGRSIAFTNRTDGVVRLADLDSGSTLQLLIGEAGSLDWQAIP